MKKVLFPILALVLALGLALPGAMPAAAHPDPGIVGLWHLDEVDTSVSPYTTPDSSGLGNTGSLYSTVSPPILVPGKFGNALSFDGTGDYVQLPASNTIVDTDIFTVEAWFKTSLNHPAYGVGDKEGRLVNLHRIGTASTAVSLYVEKDNIGLLYYTGSAHKWVKYAVNYYDGEWHHIAVTHDNTTYRLYYDGAEVASKVDAFGDFGTYPAYLGTYNSAERFFNGTIDEVRIWGEALTADQIEGSYDSGIVMFKSLSQDDADLGDIITTTVEVVAAGTGVEVVDTLPGELRYIPGTLSVTGVTATCEASEHEIACTLNQNVPYTITFDAQVTSAEAEDNLVTNTATAGDASASAELTIHPYAGFFKEILVGDEVVPLETDVHWLVIIGISNIDDEIATMENVVVKDRLGGDLELHCAVESMGAATSDTTGKTEKVHLTWDLEGNLGGNEWAYLLLDISTDENPGKGKNAPHQEYTEEGSHDLNSGAVVKFIDSETKFQLSAHTAPLEVEATEEAVVTESVLSLAQKDPTDWSIEEGGACGVLAYNLAGDTFDFGFCASDLESETNYSLIYYADFEDRLTYWGGNNPGALIATMTTERDGSVCISGSIDLGMDLPHPDDANGDITNCDYSGPPDYYEHATGAKIWLVPSELYNATAKEVTTWSPDRFLFETDLITYNDTDTP